RAGWLCVRAGAVADLVGVTGRWPVLLALVTGAARADQRAGQPAADALAGIGHQMRTHGPAALDLTDKDQRHSAVAATMQVSLDRLSADQRQRYLELAVFPEDLDIPRGVLERYWSASGGRPAFQPHRFCQQLADLSLVQDYRLDPPRLRLHDVIRSYLRHDVGSELAGLNQALIDAHRSLVLDHDGDTSWWQLPAEHAYLWSWLATHLHAAGLHEELRACLRHPGYLIGKLQMTSPARLETDLTLLDAPDLAALATVVRQNAHLIGPLEPAGSLLATLTSRLPDQAILAGL